MKAETVFLIFSPNVYPVEVYWGNVTFSSTRGTVCSSSGTIKSESLNSHIDGLFFFHFNPSAKNIPADTKVTIVKSQNDPSTDDSVKR